MGDFLLAANNSVRIYRTGETISQESFQLGWPMGVLEIVHFRFLDVSADGRTVLYSGRAGVVETLSLRPADWQAKLCELIGRREFTDEERQLVPARIPPGPLCS